METTMWAIVGARVTREQARAFARAAGIPDDFDGDDFLDHLPKPGAPRILRSHHAGAREPAWVVGVPLLDVPAEFGRLAATASPAALERTVAQVAPLLAGVAGAPTPSIILAPTSQ